MKKSKRISALIAAVIMTVSVLSSMNTAFAATGSMNCNGYVVSCLAASSNSDKNADASTICALHNCDLLYAYIIGNQQDKNGYNTKYVSAQSTGKAARTSGIASITIESNYTQFVKIVSTHIVQDGSSENSKVLQVK